MSSKTEGVTVLASDCTSFFVGRDYATKTPRTFVSCCSRVECWVGGLSGRGFM